MPIFKERDGKLKKLKTSDFDREKSLQSLVEENLYEVLDMHFLASEYATTFGGRIDTLAVDTNGAPAIIEYKKNRNHNVVNQGLSYLRWLQAQKVEFFEMLILKKLAEEIRKNLDVDWKNPRVICIAESYSKFDIDTVEVIPMRIELFRYRYYEDGILSLEPLAVSEQKSKSETTTTIEKPVIDLTIDDHIRKTSDNIKEIFNELRTRIFELDENIIEKATRLYVAYRVSKNFAEIHTGKNRLRIHLRPIEYEDPKAIVEKIPESYRWTMDRRIYLKKKEELDYIFGLIEQSYKDVL